MRNHLVYINLLLLFFHISCSNHASIDRENLIPFKNKESKWGFVDENKVIVIVCQYKRVYPFINNRAKVKNFAGQYAFIDTLGNLVFNFKDVYIEPFSKEGIAIVYNKDSKKGLIDTLGNEIVNCKYDEIEPFINYLAKVALNNKYGCIDKYGNEIIPCVYEYLQICNHNIVNIQKNDKYGYFNKLGKAITPYKYDAPGDFFYGLAAVYANKKGGYIDTTGKEKIPLQYDEVNDFSDEMGGVMIGDKCGYFNTNGEIVFKDKFTGGYWIRIPYIPNYSNGLLAFVNNRKKGWGFIDKKGEIAIPFMYDGANDFKGNFAVVEKYSNLHSNGTVETIQYGVINKKNEFVIPYTNHFIEIDSDSLFILSTQCSENRKYGLYNSQGKELLPCKYNEIKRISNQLFKLQLNNCIGIINASGNVLHNFIFKEIDSKYSEGLIAVRDKNGLGFMDEAGKIIIPCKYGHNTIGFHPEGICMVYSLTLQDNIFIDKKGNEFEIAD